MYSQLVIIAKGTISGWYKTCSPRFNLLYSFWIIKLFTIQYSRKKTWIAVLLLPCHYSGGRKCRPQGSTCGVTGPHPEQNLIPAQRHTSLTDKEVSRVVRSCYTSENLYRGPRGSMHFPQFTYIHSRTHTVRSKSLGFKTSFKPEKDLGLWTF